MRIQWWTFYEVPLFSSLLQGELQFGKLVFAKGRKLKNSTKNSQSEDKNQQYTQLTVANKVGTGLFRLTLDSKQF